MGFAMIRRMRKTVTAVAALAAGVSLRLLTKDASGKPLELVPYASTKLRISAFCCAGAGK